MRGLLYREWLLLWHQFKLGPVPVVLVMLVWLVEEFKLGFLCCMIAGCLPMASFLADEHSRWNKISAAMPLSPAMTVSARYLMSLILTAMTAAFCMLLGCFQLRAGKVDVPGFWAGSVVVIHMGLIFPALCYPALFRFGSVGMGWNGIVLCVFFLIHGLFKEYGPISSPVFWFWIQPFLVAASWRLSIRWYSRREF